MNKQYQNNLFDIFDEIMTAEIVIMNKSVVALAADSAVTIRTPDAHAKVFHTANKIFTLSKFAPVGIMISDEAVIMDVPWEIIIKSYRNELGKERFDTIEEYCNDFWRFVNEFSFEEEAERRYIDRIAYWVFQDLRNNLDAWVEKKLRQNAKIPVEETFVYLVSLIHSHALQWKQESEDEGVHDHNTVAQLCDKYQNTLLGFAKSCFENYPLTEEIYAQLCYIVIHVANVGIRFSGIVIAGYGENEYYPQCRSFGVGGVISKKTTIFKEQQYAIQAGTRSSIIPFAQDDAVRTFIDGVSPYLAGFMEQHFGKFFVEHHGTLIDGLSEDDQQKFKKLLSQIYQSAYKSGMEKFQQARIDKILQATEYGNKDELAKMAETLVHLESFGKQVVLDEETVGGPIDVAVITKGDGFIWMKRKHYFPAELNHHFFRNYFLFNETEEE